MNYIASTIDEETESYRATAEFKLNRLRRGGLTSSLMFSAPTDDDYANRLGFALQQNENRKDQHSKVGDIFLNFAKWTKWGAHEIAKFIEEASYLKDITLIYHPGAETTLTSARTLASLLEAILANPHGCIRYLRFQFVNFDGKGLDAFCRLIKESTSLRTLEFLSGFAFRSERDPEKIATAFQTMKGVTDITFKDPSSPSLDTILANVSFPPDLESLQFMILNVDGERDPGAAKGLEVFLASPKCQLKKLLFCNFFFSMESTEALANGILLNSSVEDMSFISCSFFEPALERLLQDTTSLRSIKLGCHLLESQSTVISSLQNNSSIETCHLFGLQPSFGGDLQHVLSHNQHIRSLALRKPARSRSQLIDNEDFTTMTDGLRNNPLLESLTLDNMNLMDGTCTEHLALALCPRHNDAGVDNTLTYSPLDLDLRCVILDSSLHHLFEVLQRPYCRLRRLSFWVEGFSIEMKGFHGMMEALQSNQTIESLKIGLKNYQSCSRGEHDWKPLAATMAKTLPAMSVLKDLEFFLHFDDELRHMYRRRLKSIRSDILGGMARNKSIEYLRFSDGMYATSAPNDRDFLKRVTFYGMRNRLQKKLLSLTDEERSSCLLDRLELGNRILQEELETQEPWNLNDWKEDAERINRLNKLSLTFLILRHIPHQWAQSAA